MEVEEKNDAGRVIFEHTESHSGWCVLCGYTPKDRILEQGAEQITGYKADEIVGQDCPSTKLNHIDEFGNHLCITGCPLFATNSDGIVRTEKSVRKAQRRISDSPFLTTVYPIKENGAS